MTTIGTNSTGRAQSVRRLVLAVPPLEHGDRLAREEFLRRWEATAGLKRAERINGRVVMESTIRLRASLQTQDARVPALENADVLSREEFRRRRNNMPCLKRAERFGGSVFMQAAVRFREHGQPHQDLQGWLAYYKAFTPGIEGADNPTVEVASDDAQPDGCLLISPEFGGRCRVDEQGYLVGSPELMAEVAASSASFDLHEKRESYLRSEVQEYLVWKVLERCVVWWALEQEEYIELSPDEDGIYRSRVFPGLWLDAPALVAGDLRRVIEVVHQGISSPEHAAFVARLQEQES